MTVASPPTERYQQILDAAADLFFRKGYGATTTQDVADAVGMLKGSLYHHIGSKEDLLVGIIDDVHAAAMERLSLAREREGSHLERLRWFARDHSAYNCRNIAQIGVYFREFEALAGERRERVGRDRRTYDRFVRTLIEAGQANGTIRPDLDARIAANSVLALGNWVYQWFDADAEDPDATAERVADLAIHMLEEDRP